MDKLRQLMREARKSAKARGHTLRHFKRELPWMAIAHCRDCEC